MVASKTLYLIVYDISNDKRRTKLHNLLKDYGTPVQYSVFECYLTVDETEKMQKDIKQRIRPRKDRVRIYSLCASCAAKISVTSGKEVTGEAPSAIVVG